MPKTLPLLQDTPIKNTAPQYKTEIHTLSHCITAYPSKNKLSLYHYIPPRIPLWQYTLEINPYNHRTFLITEYRQVLLLWPPSIIITRALQASRRQARAQLADAVQSISAIMLGYGGGSRHGRPPSATALDVACGSQGQLYGYRRRRKSCPALKCARLDGVLVDLFIDKSLGDGRMGGWVVKKRKRNFLSNLHWFYCFTVIDAVAAVVGVGVVSKTL